MPEKDMRIREHRVHWQNKARLSTSQKLVVLLESVAAGVYDDAPQEGLSGAAIIAWALQGPHAERGSRPGAVRM